MRRKTKKTKAVKQPGIYIVVATPHVGFIHEVNNPECGEKVGSARKNTPQMERRVM